VRITIGEKIPNLDTFAIDHLAGALAGAGTATRESRRQTTGEPENELCADLTTGPHGSANAGTWFDIALTVLELCDIFATCVAAQHENCERLAG
jgi:hypothetical protein